jgi:PLP dependent protein
MDPLTRNLEAVESRIRTACARAGRRREDVTLVAVTKTVAAAVAARLHALGVPDLGESRPQELWHKAAALPATAAWHLIGHLQRNKVEKTLPLVRLVHSADSVRLLRAIDDEAVRLGRDADVLLEVNASAEASKQGFAPDTLDEALGTIAALRRTRVCGLMTMAAFEDDPERCRPTFVRLRELRDRLRGHIDARHPLHHLSMGMSNDFEVAIEEGATLVRLGTVLFEGVSTEET